MQGDGTEQGKGGGDQGNFLDVFGVEIHPTSHVFLCFFQLINHKPIAVPPPLPLRREGEEAGKGWPTAEPT